ncbi:MAG: DUF1232 domain-containing protein [Chloroflexi bacterium]|nr:DUF1232 domain-containing protein [Chloroflexota bacterium]
MASTPKKTRSPLESLNILRELARQALLVWRLLLDQRVPRVLKLIPLATLVYFLMPIDLLPDVFLGLGQLDDLAIIIFGLNIFLRLCPPGIVRQYRDQLGSVRATPPEGKAPEEHPGRIIDAAYRVIENVQPEQDQS